jgi:hypothetical protein
LQEFILFLKNNQQKLAKLRFLSLRFTQLPEGMSCRTYLALVRYSKVQEINNFGPFIFEDPDMVI